MRGVSAEQLVWYSDSTVNGIFETKENYRKIGSEGNASDFHLGSARF
jgi:hypothetical protein